MKLSHIDLEQTLNITPLHPCEWIVESPVMFAKYIQDLLQQINGHEGHFIFSIDDTITALSKKAEIIINPFSLDINEKRIINKLYTQLNDLAYSELFYLQTQNLLRHLQHYIYDLEQESSYLLQMEKNIDLLNLFKACKIQHILYEDSIGENVCRYIKIIGEALGIKLVVFVNLRSYLTDEDIINIIHNTSYEDIAILLIESQERCCLKGVNRYIIDSDLCEI